MFRARSRQHCWPSSTRNMALASALGEVAAVWCCLWKSSIVPHALCFFFFRLKVGLTEWSHGTLSGMFGFSCLGGTSGTGPVDSPKASAKEAESEAGPTSGFCEAVTWGMKATTLSWV